MKTRSHHPRIPVAAVTLATTVGFAGCSLGSSPAANAAATASANTTTTTTATLKISPSKFPTCAESFAVTFTVSGFAASSPVNLQIGTAKADPAAVISTNASGDGSLALEFGVGVNSHDYLPGDYKFFATQPALQATKTLTVDGC